ncbi:MAG: diguanylate cyclase [Magnetococcus sp. YQC-5]
MASILVVDDDSQAIEQTSRLITNAGHMADFLLESQFLISKLEGMPPDLLLLDVNMPEIDGVTLLRRIKALPNLRDIPVIMITGETDESLIQECFQIGAVDFVNKPIRPLELISRIRIALDTKAYIDAIQTQQNALQQANAFIFAILDTMEDAICVIDRHSKTIVEANRAFLEQHGVARHQAVGVPCVDLLGHKSHSCLRCDDPDGGCILHTTIETGETTCHEFSTTSSSGTPTHTKVYTLPIRNSSNLTSRIVYLERDVTKTKELQNHLQHLAFHDPLTRLPNRQLFDDRLRQALAQGRRHNQMVAVMLFDLDHFKEINDTFGHSAGDILLQEVARRLGACIRESDTVARLGGDEFTAVLTNVTNSRQVQKVAHKILRALSRKFVLHTNKVKITSSIGVSLFPKDGEEMIELFNKADQALYRAKSAGRNNVQFHTPLDPKT